MGWLSRELSSFRRASPWRDESRTWPIKASQWTWRWFVAHARIFAPPIFTRLDNGSVRFPPVPYHRFLRYFKTYRSRRWIPWNLRRLVIHWLKNYVLSSTGAFIFEFSCLRNDIGRLVDHLVAGDWLQLASTEILVDHGAWYFATLVLYWTRTIYASIRIFILTRARSKITLNSLFLKMFRLFQSTFNLLYTLKNEKVQKRFVPIIFTTNGQIKSKFESSEINFVTLYPSLLW